MNKNLTVKKSITINAPASKVWQVLTNPETVKQFLFGAELKTDWQIGSDIVFQGSYQGMNYKDKGKIVVFEPNKKLQYTYLSSFSGLEDQEENYSLVTYELHEEDGHTVLTGSQQGFADEEKMEHAKMGWQTSLEDIKKLAEV